MKWGSLMVTFLMATMRVRALHLDDAVDEEERVAVGEEGHDLEDVHGCGEGRWFGHGAGFSLDFSHGKDEYKRRIEGDS